MYMLPFGCLLYYIYIYVCVCVCETKACGSVQGERKELKTFVIVFFLSCFSKNDMCSTSLLRLPWKQPGGLHRQWSPTNVVMATWMSPATLTVSVLHCQRAPLKGSEHYKATQPEIRCHRGGLGDNVENPCPLAWPLPLMYEGISAGVRGY